MTDSKHNPNRAQRPKSLWEVMSHGEQSAAEESTQTPAESSPPLKSLWQLMGSRPFEPEVEEISKETTATPLRDEVTTDFDMITEAADDKVAQPRPAKRESAPRDKQPPAPKPWKNTAALDPVAQIKIRTSHELPSSPKKSSKALTSVILGSCAILLSGLALFPGMWTKFPALGLGFVALFSGFLAADEIRTSRGRQTGMNQALAGMALSIIGMFLGPLLAWSLGGLALFQSNQQATVAHLEAVGVAIGDYYDQRQQFPAGGTFEHQPDGKLQPMHGWMTPLLPYLGYESLHDSINQSLPFDNNANFKAMRTTVPEFLIAGVPQTNSVKGFAATHFAGVGGEETDAQGQKIHFGIFGRDSVVFHESVTDGLSNTIMAGELPSNFPAWGDPQNWRQIGKGLNRDTRGFGNASGGPVLFLMADGSVRQFSPDTDPRVLRSMSTRDGGD